VDVVLQNAWIIALLPLLTAGVITLFAPYLGKKAGWLGTIVMGINTVLAVMVLLAMNSAHAESAIEPVYHQVWTQWSIFGSKAINVGFQVDNLTAIMLVIVTLVSFCVQLYSNGYMAHDRRITRYYAAINLFTTGMLGLVFADNYIVLLISWEIMGLCSYLLIGHWYERAYVQKAAMKAFITTRIGDVGMMLGIWMLYKMTGSFNFEEIFAQVGTVAGATPGLLAVASLLVFVGAVGKSAQFPLHTWLPDAMAGPTPGSALIHAATMVAAGVFLVARSYPVFLAAPDYVLGIVALVGGFTSLFAASIATVRTDIKQVLAYSTVSQLGYMIMALGVGSFAAGMFHLMTHAFFKALLFLAAGAVIEACHHNQEMHQMGGLRKKIPITFAMWMIGYLALAGFPGFSGFFSKDELLLAAFNWHGPEGWGGFLTMLPFLMALTTALLTAYYMTRATVLTFFGKPRSETAEHAHEVSSVMWLPLVILGVPALLSGYSWAHLLGFTWLEHFLEFPGIHVNTENAVLVTGMATAAGLTGIFIGWLLYARTKPAARAKALKGLRPLYVTLQNKYWVDEIYEAIFVKGTFAFANLVALVDRYVVDGLVNSFGWIARTGGAGLRRLATGNVQQYMLTLVSVVVVGVILFEVFK
jgi:NADH-quinone oxidoreductase subunit L